MKANFEACMAEVFKHEGGYVNDPHDPGGETNMGISKRSYPKENIRGMTRARAAQIYHKDFWDKLKCDDLPAGLDLVAFEKFRKFVLVICHNSGKRNSKVVS